MAAFLMFKFVFSLKRKTVEELDSLYEIIDDHNSKPLKKVQF